MEKFKSIICRLEEDFARAQRELEAAKETTMAEYKEFEVYKEDFVDGNLEATKIDFNSLYDKLAGNHLSMDLSCFGSASKGAHS